MKSFFKRHKISTGFLIFILFWAIYGIIKIQPCPLCVNKYKDGFYFEKFDKAEELKAYLLEMFPIGSDVKPLIRFLENAGAKQYNPYRVYDTTKQRLIVEEIPEGDIYMGYRHNIVSIFWRDITFILQQKDNKLVYISTSFYSGP